MGGASERLARTHAVARLSTESRRRTRCPSAAPGTHTIPGAGGTLSAVRPAAASREPGRRIQPMYHRAAALQQPSLRDTPFGDVRGLRAAPLAARPKLGEKLEPSVQRGEPMIAATAPEASADVAEQMTLF